jgi:hypothetical protein
MSLLAGLTDPVFMAKIAEHRRIVDRLAEQMGSTRKEAADALFRFEAVTTSEGQTLH